MGLYRKVNMYVFRRINSWVVFWGLSVVTESRISGAGIVWR
jgi:hypothetical protein